MQGSFASEQGAKSAVAAVEIDFANTSVRPRLDAEDETPVLDPQIQLFAVIVLVDHGGNNFFQGNVLTFGSDLTSSINNGALFSFDGDFTSSFDSGNNTFTITAIPEPSTYLAAAGLLALMLWPSRRRLIRDAQKILGLRAPMRDRLAVLRGS